MRKDFNPEKLKLNISKIQAGTRSKEMVDILYWNRC
jgi:hypothetical protein